MYDQLFDDPELIDDEDDYEEVYSSVDTGLDNPHQFPVRIHALADGATSLDMMAEMLRDYANFLDAMHEDGFQLSGPIKNGQGFAFVDNIAE